MRLTAYQIVRLSVILREASVALAVGVLLGGILT